MPSFTDFVLCAKCHGDAKAVAQLEATLRHMAAEHAAGRLVAGPELAAVLRWVAKG